MSEKASRLKTPLLLHRPSTSRDLNTTLREHGLDSRLFLSRSCSQKSRLFLKKSHSTLEAEWGEGGGGKERERERGRERTSD